MEEDCLEGNRCSFKEVSWRPVNEQTDLTENAMSSGDTSPVHEETFYGAVSQNEEQYKIAKQEEIEVERFQYIC